ncbi:5-methylcytosine restriction system specificity protein McrC [Chryseobacterium bernardetii]|uniref:5-methylcytosine restriction system specificity protein McrC n=1 Tax=Chryseobacterium bernardetii TaxID=1241978 RepID=UPI003019638E
MYLTLPINTNYGNDKSPFTINDLKELCRSQNTLFDKCILTDFFENYEELYIDDKRFSDLSLISLRKSNIADKDKNAFVIKFYKKKINGETHYYIETGQYAGYIHYKGLTINLSLSEKYNHTVLNHLLTYANNISLDSTEIATGFNKKTNELEYLLCFMFVQSLEKASILGLPKKYQNIDARITMAKGKINFNSFIKKDIPFNGKISVQYRDRLDIQEITDVLFYTLTIIKNKFSSQSIFTVRNIYNDLLPKFSKIKPSTDTIQKAKSNPVLLNPLFMQYKKVIELAELIIKELTPDLKKENREKITGNLYNTSELFEIYIEKILKNNLKNWQINVQKEISIYNGLFYKRKLIPDFVLYNYQKKQYIVLDAKFKTMNYHYYDVDREDIFQLHTYSYFYHDNLLLAGLIYPLQKQEENHQKHIASTLDKYSNQFGILGIELNKDSTIESIKKSEIYFTDQINSLGKTIYKDLHS